MNFIFRKIYVALVYVIMIFVNYLANALPINNIDTGAVSDLYPNLFAPAGITFSIWGIIYLLLGLFVLYQFGTFKKISLKEDKLLNKIGIYFITSSIFNALWIFSWHYGLLWMSIIFMLGILFCLIKINLLIRENNSKELFFLSLPFSIYFGWITVATIANITALLVSVGWNGFGISESIWTIAILLVGSIIGILTSVKNKDIAYILVFAWAYIGIIIKHTSSVGFNNQYPEIITASAICIVLFLITIGFLLYKKA
jgi:hypothetical protein